MVPYHPAGIPAPVPTTGRPWPMRFELGALTPVNMEFR